MSKEDANAVVVEVHKQLPKEYSSIKNYKIDRSTALSSGIGRGKSKR